ncbi:unnamed protein product [Ambrosiozyma monospora]|uniref:Unnamed protein product n=1 Tax=Ambrosiozyma monospora TaxID=43982 RepID=A0A9W7DCI3_AMBMO|nr:unnamed protein product [Ambrosiozyma monospora]
MPSSATSTPGAGSSASSKPGRKPLQTEPKNKRTAQNRAAQRAFRERKERKMKELEMQVEMLENEKLQISNETELLRVQVETLMKELNKFKSQTAQQQGVQPFQQPAPSQRSIMGSSYSLSDKSLSSNSNKTSPLNMIDSPASSMSSHTHNSGIDKQQRQPSFQFPSPWGAGSDISTSPSDVWKTRSHSSIHTSNGNGSSGSPLDINQPTLKGGDYIESVSDFCNSLSSVCGSSSCPIPKERRDSAYKSPAAASVPSAAISGSGSISTASHSSSIRGADSLLSMTTVESPFQSLVKEDSTTKNVGSAAAGKTLNDPSIFLFDGTSAPFDTSLVFNTENDPFSASSMYYNSTHGNGATDDLFGDVNFNDGAEADPLAGLVTEESKYDPFSELLNGTDTAMTSMDANLTLLNNNNNNNNNNSDLNQQYTTAKIPTTNPITSATMAKQDTTTSSDSDDDFKAVPDNTGSLMKCSQIWERITSHPRFSDLDIDGLCHELKQKAKCSEKGVVVDGAAVGEVLKSALVKSNMKKADATVNQFMKGLF